MVEIDEEMVYKATVLKQLTNANPLSLDRLRKVQCLTRYHGQETSVDLDDIVSVGDPIVINQSGATKVGNICEIHSGENKVQFLPQDQLEQLHVMLTV